MRLSMFGISWRWSPLHRNRKQGLKPQLKAKVKTS